MNERNRIGKEEYFLWQVDFRLLITRLETEMPRHSLLSIT